MQHSWMEANISDIIYMQRQYKVFIIKQNNVQLNFTLKFDKRWLYYILLEINKKTKHTPVEIWL